MSTITPYQFFAAIFPQPLRPGQLMVWSKIRRSGKTITDWCYDLHQAGRQVETYLRSREVFFGVALQDCKKALRRARRRFKRAAPSKVRGGDESVTALPALWAEIRVADSPLDPGRAQALKAFEAVSPPPSIVVWTGTAVQAYWLVAGRRPGEPWVLENENERRRARRVLGKVRWALARAAAAQGWGPEAAAEAPEDDRPAEARLSEVRLSGLVRVAGTFHHRGKQRWPVVVERLPGTRESGGRYRVEDFEDLEDPPRRPTDPRPWETGDGSAVPRADFEAVWRGCSWLRHCYEDRATLPEREWQAALSIVGRARAASSSPDGADGRSLAHRFSAGHPGYAPDLTERALKRALAREAETCARVGRGLGAWKRHCSRCPHQGRIESPIDLGRRGGDEPQPLASPIAGEESHGAAVAAEGAGATPAPRPDVAPPAPAEAPQVELVIRLPSGTPQPGPPQPGAPQPDWAPLVRAAIAGVERSIGVEAAGDRPAREPRSDPAACGRELFLEGLEELLATLGGEPSAAAGPADRRHGVLPGAPASARQLAAILAAPRNRDRFGRLRAALRELVPGLQGGAPTARQLGRVLGSVRGWWHGGRTIARVARSPEGWMWALRRERKPVGPRGGCPPERHRGPASQTAAAAATTPGPAGPGPGKEDDV
jgi:hypothetical protein